MCRPRFEQPSRTALAFSSPRSALATPPFIFIARTVATMTTARRRETCHPALDVHEFLGTEIGAESGFRDDVVGQFQRRRCGHYRIAAVRDVRERSAVNECGIVLERLDEVRLQCLLQEDRHGPVGLEVAAIDRRPVPAVADDDVAEPPLQVIEVGGETEDGHDLRRNRDVETGLPRKAVRDAAERRHDTSERAVVHVENAAPGHATLVDLKPVPPSRCGCR